MHPMAYLDLVAVLACGAALGFVIWGRRQQRFLPAVTTLLLVLLTLMTCYRIALLVEWSGVTSRLDWLEDFAGVFIPFTWAFVFYAFVKNAVEDELRASRERFKALTERTSDWIWECDRHGVFTYSGPQVRTQLGYEPEEIYHKSMFECMASPDDEAFRARFEEAVQGRAMIFQEPVYFRSRRRESPCLEISAVPILSRDGRLIGYRGVNRDITERTRAKQALRESTARLQSVFDSSPLAITVTDLEGNIIDCSAAVLETYGLASKAEALGGSVFDLIAEKDRARARTMLAELLHVGSIREAEYTLVTKDGTEFPGEFSASLMRDLEQQPLGLVGISMDVTERKRAEGDLVTQQRRLRSLTLELSLTEERERRRIAAGLHDFACQNLVLSKMKLESLRMPLSATDLEEIAGVCNTLDRTIESVRRLIFDLSSPTLYKFGLEAAVEELLEDRVKAQHGIQCSFRDDGAVKQLAENVRILLFQSVRELLINVVKHAQARAVTVDVARCNDTISTLPWVTTASASMSRTC